MAAKLVVVVSAFGAEKIDEDTAESLLFVDFESTSGKGKLSSISLEDLKKRIHGKQVKVDEKEVVYDQRED